MFGLGKMGDIISLISDKEKLATTIKDQVPGLLDALLKAISAKAGAAEGDETAVVFFTAATAAGPTTMARVHRVDAFGELGEELSTMDVPAVLRSIPNETITSLMPF
jgi:hypothetical protein